MLQLPGPLAEAGVVGNGPHADRQGSASGGLISEAGHVRRGQAMAQGGGGGAGAAVVNRSPQLPEQPTLGAFLQDIHRAWQRRARAETMHPQSGDR